MNVNARRLLLYYFSTFALLLVSELVGYELTVSGTLDLASEVNGLSSLNLNAGLGTVFLIFSHNAIINLAIGIPFVGPLAYVFSIGETGLLLGYVAAAVPPYYEMGASAVPLTYALTALMPHGWLELLAYSISLYASMDLGLSVVRRERVDAVRWLVLLSISMAVLLAAAAVETFELGFVHGLVH